MNAIDVAFIAVLGYGIYKGYNHGFVGSLWGMLQMVFSVIVALRFSYIASSIFERMLGINNAITPLLGFVFMFLLSLGIFYIIGYGINMFVKATHASTLSQTVGTFIWMLMLSIGFSFGLLLSNSAGMLSSSVTNNSVVYPYVEPASRIVLCKMDFVRPSLEKLFRSLGDAGKIALDKALGECGGGTVVVTQPTQEQQNK